MRGVRYEVQVVPGTTTTLATAICCQRLHPCHRHDRLRADPCFNADLGAKYAIKDAEAKARQGCGSWKAGGSSVTSRNLCCW